MFKDMNWNVLVPTVVGTLIVGVVLYFVTKPGGLLNKFDGDEDEE